MQQLCEEVPSLVFVELTPTLEVVQHVTTRSKLHNNKQLVSRREDFE
jgi:hypothetical protein